VPLKASNDLEVLRDVAHLHSVRRAVRRHCRQEVDAAYVIAPFIHDRNPDAVAAVASSMGIVVVWPRP